MWSRSQQTCPKMLCSGTGGAQPMAGWSYLSWSFSPPIPLSPALPTGSGLHPSTCLFQSVKAEGMPQRRRERRPHCGTWGCPGARFARPDFKLMSLRQGREPTGRGCGSPECILGVTAQCDCGLPCQSVLVPKPLPTLAVSLSLTESCLGHCGLMLQQRAQR